MEFTYESAEDEFTPLVQLKYLSVYDDRGKVEIPEVDPAKIVLRGNRMVANGRLENIRHIVYVDPELYGKKPDFYDVARAIGDINETGRREVSPRRSRSLGEFQSCSGSTGTVQ